MKNIFLFIILLSFYSCKEDDKKISTEEIPEKLNEVSGNQGFELIYQSDTVSDSDPDKTGSKSPVYTNENEKTNDEKRIERLKEDLKESKYSTCDEIIVDYERIIDALEKGDKKPLKEFPLDKDPKIAICRRVDANFSQKLDSLQDVSSKILDNM